MQKEEIVQAIRNYINDDKAQYAVLINGGWGVGKTYLYEHSLKAEIAHMENGSSDRKANVYISLYGISSTEQLSKEIVTNYLLKVKLNGNANKEKIYRQISKAAGIISKMFSFSVNGLTVDFDKGIEEAIDSIEFKNMVICLDDLERCSIPVNDLFGMINNLVEHCNCKVIILADEANIGKMYANTKVEEKYITLLMGRKLKVKESPEKKQSRGQDKENKDTSADELTVEELKKINEKIYSENYIYKDIKEKVIGLTLKYTPDLNTEFDTIIEEAVNNEKLADMLRQRKEKILEYMNLCENDNIRIMRIWLNGFERIYRVIHKNFENDKYFNSVFERFMVYSIRVACAVGKNKNLTEWEENTEVGSIELDDGILFHIQGYRFVDDLFRDSVFNEMRICQAAKFIIEDKADEEEAGKENAKGGTLRKLNKWYYLEDEEIEQSLPALKEEINNDEYTPQHYQNIIALLVVLNQERYLENNFLSEVSDMLKGKINHMEGRIVVENFHQSFPAQDAFCLFHKYYDSIYALILKKNRKIDKQEIAQTLNTANGDEFLNYCQNNYDKFIVRKSFMSYIDMNSLIKVIRTGSIEGIYHIAAGFKKIYHFDNLYEFYSDDMKRLKELKGKIDKLPCRGNTHQKAVKNLSDVLDDIIEVIIHKGRDNIEV